MTWINANKDSKKILWIHAGPHKTASTYIIKNLRKNRSILRRQGIHISHDNISDSQHLIRKDWQHLHQMLETMPRGTNQYFLSRETLHSRVVKPRFFQPLLEKAACHGFQLGFIFILRDQSDWINSMYAHQIRHLKVKRSFGQYRRSIINRSAHFGVNYLNKFEAIVKHPDIKTIFIPLSRHANIPDPFLAIMNALGLKIPTYKWTIVDSSASNIQPGTKAIWLSETCLNILDELKINLKDLNQKAHAIRDIALNQGWQYDRYFAFTPNQYQKTRDFYATANEQFAQTHWNCDWESLFPHRQPTKRNIYKGPSSKQERKQMLSLLLKALETMNLPQESVPAVRKAFRRHCRHNS